MSISQNYKELFRYPTITEIVSTFQSLLDSRDIASDEALAFAGVIHANLRSLQGNDGYIYAKYAQAMAFLLHTMPDVYNHVVSNWRLPSKNSSKREKNYDDSLFDDTVVTQAQIGKSIYEPNKGTEA
jgi:hypothetical protein